MNLSWVSLGECVWPQRNQMLESFRILVWTLKLFESSHLFPGADVNKQDQGVYLLHHKQVLWFLKQYIDKKFFGIRYIV